MVLRNLIKNKTIGSVSFVLLTHPWGLKDCGVCTIQLVGSDPLFSIIHYILQSLENSFQQQRCKTVLLS